VISAYFELPHEGREIRSMGAASPIVLASQSAI